jgi:ATP-dependent helicase STH1/SNF2
LILALPCVVSKIVEEKILARANEKLNMSELVVEAGKFNQESVENDNSMERKKMMEVLLIDFESNANKNQEKLDRTSEDGEDDDDDKDSTSNANDINELLSNNEQDYQVYSDIDEMRATAPCPALYVDPNDVPDWIKYPLGSKEASEVAVFDPDAGRKRNAVAYDDGLTEKQFLRLMETQARDDEVNARKRKAGKISSKPDLVEGAAKIAATAASKSPGTMTEWTFRKLINTCKSVIALKDPATKRRLSDIFLEKPDPNVYPDYYSSIERPIAINDILRKCRGHLYANVPEFWDDWKLLVSNAKKFNGEGSWVANDADALQRELERVMRKNGLEEQPPPPKQVKKLRIKLSLKGVKPIDDGDETAKPPNKRRRKSEEG